MKHSVVYILLPLIGISLAHGHVNVALRGRATMSYQGIDNSRDAKFAIDGNTDSNFEAGSCSSTIEMSGPWWRVDLLDRYVITSVVVTNRADCCSEKIDGAEVHIGDSLQDNGTANPLAAVISYIPGVSVYNLAVDNMEGRYLTISLPGYNKTLTLCEVQIYGYPAPTSVNIALRGRASQSSLEPPGFAFLANDGNKDNNVAHGSCSHTKNESTPWWRLDLVRPHKVFVIKITGPADALHSSGLSGAEVRIGNSLENNGNDNPRCAVLDSFPNCAFAELICNGMDGRYINIVTPGRETDLSLCEVEVSGSVLDFEGPGLVLPGHGTELVNKTLI